jgi:hypothetical protein
MHFMLFNYAYCYTDKHDRRDIYIICNWRYNSRYRIWIWICIQWHYNDNYNNNNNSISSHKPRLVPRDKTFNNRISKSKNRKHNDQAKRNKRTNNDIQNTAQKTKDRATRRWTRKGEQFLLVLYLCRPIILHGSYMPWPIEQHIYKHPIFILPFQ